MTIETFADVLHHLIDVVLEGETADKAHAVIDQSSGPRTAPPEPAPAPADAPAADQAPADAPADPNAPPDPTPAA